MARGISTAKQAMEDYREPDDQHIGTVERIAIEEGSGKEPSYAKVSIRHGEKPKPSKGNDVPSGPYPRSSDICMSAEAASGLKIGQKVRIALEPGE